MSKPTLSYWDIRGLAQPIRNLLHYAGVDFVDKTYTGPVIIDKTKPTEWHLEKFTLGLPFPNIPNYFDGDLKVNNCFSKHSFLSYLDYTLIFS